MNLRKYLCPPMKNPSTSTINWIILIALAFVWGSSFILMKRGNETFSWDEVASLRMFIAFVFLIPFMIAKVRRAEADKWPAFLIVGLLGNFIPAYLFTKSETVLSSALAGMLNSLTPLFTLIIGVFIFKMKTTKFQLIGILIGLCGAVGLVLSGSTSEGSYNFSYSMMVVAATICYAISVNSIRSHLTGLNPVTITSWSFLLVGPFAGAHLFYKGFFERLGDPAIGPGLFYVSVLSIFGTALSVIIFNILIRNTSALFASSVTYLIPIVAMFWGALDKEHIGLQHIISILVILCGVYLVNSKRA